MRATTVTALLFAGLASLSTAATITLKNGTAIVGEVIKDDAEQVTIQADLIGQITVKRSDVANVAQSSTGAAAADSAVTRATAPEPVQVAKQEAERDPTKPFWKRTLSFSGSYSSANYDQGTLGAGIPPGLPDTGASLGLQGATSTFNISALVIRATPKQVFEFRGSYGNAEYEPAGQVVDNYSGEASLIQIFTPKTYALGSVSYKVDKIALIDHEFEQIIGYGYKAIDDDRVKLDLIPGIALSESKQGTQYDGDWIFSAGFLERFEYHFNERVSLIQRLKYRIGIEDSNVWKLNAEVKLKAGLTEHASVTVTGIYTYDNTLGPIPPTILNGLGSLGPYYSGFRPAEKGRLSLESGLEFDF